MKNVLVIESSPNGENSTSKKGTQHLLSKLKTVNNNQLEIRVRDLNLNPVPHLNGQTVSAMFTPAENRTAEQTKAIELSDTLVQELLWANEIVIGLPMWNFGVPSVVKAWIDHVSRAGLTFRFGPNGLEGLAAGRKVYLVVSSGSVFSEGPFSSYDQVVPYIKTFFGFIGITDVEVVRVEGTNDPAARDLVFKKVDDTINSLVK